MKEYGSNVQKLVEHIISEDDKETRTKHAHIMVELMRQIHPQMRDGNDYSKKLWDDLYVMADFNLDVDSPFPPPPKDIMGKKPNKMVYRQNNLKHKYYGNNINLLILKAIATESFDERKAFVSYLVKLMQNFFLAWNKNTISTEQCLEQLLEISEYKLQEEVAAILKDGLIPNANPKDGNRSPNRFNNAKTFKTQQRNQGTNKRYKGGSKNKNKNNNRNRNTGGGNSNGGNTSNTGNAGNTGNKFSKPRRRY